MPQPRADTGFSEESVAVPTGRWNLSSAIGSSSEEGNHALGVPQQLAEKLPTEMLVRLTGKMPMIVLAELFGRVCTTEPPHSNDKGADWPSVSKVAACWLGSQPLADELSEEETRYHQFREEKPFCSVPPALPSISSADRALCHLAREGTKDGFGAKRQWTDDWLKGYICMYMSKWLNNCLCST